MTITITSAKLNLPFKAGQLPAIDPENPRFTIDLGGVKIRAEVSAKAARKLAAWQGGVVLTGKLIVDRGQLVLMEAGFQFLEARPAGPGAETPAGGTP